MNTATLSNNVNMFFAKLTKNDFIRRIQGHKINCDKIKLCSLYCIFIQKITKKEGVLKRYVKFGMCETSRLDKRISEIRERFSPNDDYVLKVCYWGLTENPQRKWTDLHTRILEKRVISYFIDCHEYARANIGKYPRELFVLDNDRDEVWTAQQMRALINYLDDNAELSTLGKIGRANIRYSDIMGNT